MKNWKIGDFQATINTQRLAIEDKNSEIIRLETLLTPFRRIALERFVGPEQAALRKLADEIIAVRDDIEEIKPRLTILQQHATETSDGSSQLTMVMGSDAHQKIPKPGLELVFDRPFRTVRFNYSWELPATSGVRYFEPVLLADKTKRIQYTAKEDLPPGFFLHFMFTSDEPLQLISSTLNP